VKYYCHQTYYHRHHADTFFIILHASLVGYQRKQNSRFQDLHWPLFILKISRENFNEFYESLNRSQKLDMSTMQKRMQPLERMNDINRQRQECESKLKKIEEEKKSLEKDLKKKKRDFHKVLRRTKKINRKHNGE
jgi:septal ring factor EnvC (AmiA/AmiB activator)